ncbi:TnsA endonuclease N-terminal domain-containing protein [Candidatus Lokiarchaeum ossiferum]|uniref:TnsA endonuclease N-terminal domain-containing protein n=1 Tax=Candidatus Lokiarchaeum ossiferum TaxID=2951803 RepID=UPI00352E64AE
MIQNSFISDDGKEFNYYRPSQVRDIPMKSGSIRGFIPSLKPNLKGNVWNYESQLERDFLYLLDHDPNCIDLQTQPCHISYITKEGKKVTATPDVWALFQDRNQVLFEVKPENNLRNLEEDENWQRKTQAIIRYCSDLNLNWTYMIITEKKIWCIRLDNLKDLLGAAKHYSPIKIDFDLGHFDSALRNILNKNSMKFGDLVRQLESMLPLKREEIISVLKHQIYYNYIHINWDTELEKTRISLESKTPIIPIYCIPETTHGIKKTFKINKKSNEKATILYSEQDMQKYEKKITLLTPIIDQYGKNAKKAEIFQFCEKKGFSFHTAYRWYLIWKKEGRNGLYPKLSKKHKTPHLKNKLASKMMKNFILEWNMGEWQTYVQAYKEFKADCIQAHIPTHEIPSLQTFRNWIKRLPAVEQRGKFKPSAQKYIKKGYRSTYQEGRYPGAIIQMDHTLLDIWLVDSFTR